MAYKSASYKAQNDWNTQLRRENTRLKEEIRRLKEEVEFLKSKKIKDQFDKVIFGGTI